MRIAPLAGGEARVATTQRGPLNAVGFAPDGRSIVTGGHDGALRIIPSTAARSGWWSSACR